MKSFKGNIGKYYGLINLPTIPEKESQIQVEPTIDNSTVKWVNISVEKSNQIKKIIQDFDYFKSEPKSSNCKNFLTIITTVPEDSSEKEIQEHIKNVEEDFEEKVRKELLNLLKKMKP